MNLPEFCNVLEVGSEFSMAADDSILKLWGDVIHLLKRQSRVWEDNSL